MSKVFQTIVIALLSLIIILLCFLTFRGMNSSEEFKIIVVCFYMNVDQYQLLTDFAKKNNIASVIKSGWGNYPQIFELSPFVNYKEAAVIGQKISSYFDFVEKIEIKKIE